MTASKDFKDCHTKSNFHYLVAFRGGTYKQYIL